jgi:ABC-type glutathione transport system ATPase component
MRTAQHDRRAGPAPKRRFEPTHRPNHHRGRFASTCCHGPTQANSKQLRAGGYAPFPVLQEICRIKAEQLTGMAISCVDRIDFTIDRRNRGLLGHNGAGKTTIMKMLTGYLEPSAGRVCVDGVDVAEQPKVVQRSLGYLSESLPLYPEMTVIDYLEYAAELRGVAPPDQPDAVREAIEATESRRSMRFALSRGYRPRVPSPEFCTSRVFSCSTNHERTRSSEQRAT